MNLRNDLGFSTWLKIKDQENFLGFVGPLLNPKAKPCVKFNGANFKMMVSCNIGKEWDVDVLCAKTLVSLRACNCEWIACNL